MPGLVMSNDELNKLYTSTDPEDLLKFYGSFKLQEEVVAWMKARPSENMNLYEQEGNSKISVVIPTADINGKLANDSKTMFSGVYTVFVESKGPNFNFARSCNLGIAKALERNPEWVIVANDDLRKIDGLDVLSHALDGVDRNVKMVYTKHTHGIPAFNCMLVNSTNPLVGLLMRRTNAEKRANQLAKQLGVKYAAYTLDPLRQESRFEEQKMRLIATLLGYRRKFVMQGPFTILRADFARQSGGKVYDEAYINSYEDIDLFYNISKSHKDYAFITFKIGHKDSASLGKGEMNNLRAIANKIYFNYKYRKELDAVKLHGGVL